MNRVFQAICFVSLAGMNLATVSATEEASIAITQESGKFRVMLGNELFCEVDHQTYEKPIVYPIYAPGQIAVTRNYPMRPGTAGEATDHPHHKSMWFGHGDVNGISFWHGEGKIVTEKAELVSGDELPASLRHQPTIRLQDRLVDPKGRLVCRETVLLSFGAGPSRRWIDWHITLHAGDEPIRLGDTKEGTAALRVHPNLRPDQRSTRGTDIPSARAVNSEGLEGEAIWGQRAKWVDYTGTIDGQTVGIAFFDNPQNLRYPTYWHARSYGLFAANPFGLSQFVGPGEDGSYTIPAEESLEFQYRIVFHAGDATQADVEQLFQDYVQVVN